MTSARRTLDDPDTRVGAVLAGKYKLLEQIGEGGMGTIWMAEQKEPVKRRVALKIIKLGMDTKQVIARFEAERQALAMMDHPNIARVFDAGATATGRPYFVMEYIKGVPILDYCDLEKGDTRARLELFTSVCHAIQHAHQKGVIHRDIKPSNVLVTMHDGVPVPKVIDFGIAKATNSELTTKTLFTEHRQMVGTPAYMSPEQAEMSGLDIDTRSDIYSLGVLLYELLTGTTPFDTKALLAKGFAEMMRTIREDEPHKPSTRVSTLGDTASRLALQRRADVKQLSSLLRGDLDWIVMKCLEKDRTHRYETANGLAADIGRHLRHEPVTAGAPGTAYRLRKFVRRNRVQVIAGSATALALVLGVIGTTIGMVQALDEKDRADQQATKATLAAEAETKARAAAQRNEQDAIAAAQRAEAARQKETAARERAEIVAEFLAETLGGAAPSVARGRDTTMLREMMDIAMARIESGHLVSVPDAELELRIAIGGTYRALANYDQAQRMLGPAVVLARATHAEDHDLTANALDALSHLLLDRGDVARAEALSREALAMKQRLFPGDNQSVSFGLNNLAAVREACGDWNEAERLLRASLEMSKRLYPGDHHDVACSLGNLSNVLNERGELAEAERLAREALEMDRRLAPGDHPSTAVGLHSLAQIVFARGDWTTAEALHREAVDMWRRLYPDGHPHLANGLGGIGNVLKARRDTARAEPYFREALAMRRRLTGNDHHAVATSLVNLADNLNERGRFAEAEQLFREAVDTCRRARRGDHRHLANALNGLAVALQSQGKLDAAEPICREAVAMRERSLPGDHPEVATGLNNLAFLLQLRGDRVEAERIYRDALAMRRRLFKGDHPNLETSLTNLACLLKDGGDPAAAEPLFREALAMAQRVYAADQPDLADANYNLADLLRERGDAAGAEPLYRQALAINEQRCAGGDAKVVHTRQRLVEVLRTLGKFDQAFVQQREVLAGARAALPPDHLDLAAQLATMSSTLLSLQQWAEAEPFAREALGIREAKVPDDWRTFNVRSMLGEALLGQQRFAAAEPLLLAGCRGLMERRAAMSPPASTDRIADALARLVRLYEATGDEAEAAAWRARLETVRAGQ